MYWGAQDNKLLGISRKGLGSVRLTGLSADSLWDLGATDPVRSCSSVSCVLRGFISYEGLLAVGKHNPNPQNHFGPGIVSLFRAQWVEGCTGELSSWLSVKIISSLTRHIRLIPSHYNRPRLLKSLHAKLSMLRQEIRHDIFWTRVAYLGLHITVLHFIRCPTATA